jgi:hypothetical protein
VTGLQKRKLAKKKTKEKTRKYTQNPPVPVHGVGVLNRWLPGYTLPGTRTGTRHPCRSPLLGRPATGRWDSKDLRPLPQSAGAQPPPTSEGLRFFARRYVLDPGTRIDDIHMVSVSNGYCRSLKIVITLDAADGV